MNEKALGAIHKMVLSHNPTPKELRRVYKMLEKNMLADKMPLVEDAFLTFLCAFLLKRPTELLYTYLDYIEISQQKQDLLKYERKNLAKRLRSYLKTNQNSEAVKLSQKTVADLLEKHDLYW